MSAEPKLPLHRWRTHEQASKHRRTTSATASELTVHIQRMHPKRSLPVLHACICGGGFFAAALRAEFEQQKAAYSLTSQPSRFSRCRPRPRSRGASDAKGSTSSFFDTEFCRACQVRGVTSAKFANLIRQAPPKRALAATAMDGDGLASFLFSDSTPGLIRTILALVGWHPVRPRLPRPARPAPRAFKLQRTRCAWALPVQASGGPAATLFLSVSLLFFFGWKDAWLLCASVCSFFLCACGAIIAVVRLVL